MRSLTDVSYYLLFPSALISLLLGSIASPIIGGEKSWATLSEPEFLAFASPDAANLPATGAPDMGADWGSLTASWNNVQLGNTAGEVVAPQPENIPRLISDGMVRGTLSPQPRGRPQSQHPELKEWDFRKYPGYPSEDNPDLYDPKTGMYWAQKRLSCLNEQQLFCCRPDDIKCCTFLSNWPQCISRQQRCCDRIDEYENGENCSAAKGPGQVVPEAKPQEDINEGSYQPLPQHNPQR